MARTAAAPGTGARQNTIPTAPEAAADGGPLAEALAAAGQAAGDALARPDPEAAVHGLRRALKRARALLRLLPGPGEDAARRLGRELAVAARSLAAVRDVHILRETLAGLAERFAAAEIGIVARSVHDRAAVAPQSATLALEAAGRDDLPGRIAAAGALSPLPPRKLPRALADGYARARRAARKLSPDDADGLHELRKHVVVHFYQMELARPWWPKVGKAWRRELGRLRETLGRHHDLEILILHLGGAQERREERGEDRPLSPHAAAVTMEAAHARQRHLAAKALRRHARLFAERPKAFRRRIAAYRRAWSRMQRGTA